MHNVFQEGVCEMRNFLIILCAVFLMGMATVEAKTRPGDFDRPGDTPAAERNNCGECHARNRGGAAGVTPPANHRRGALKDCLGNYITRPGQFPCTSNKK